jgi:hypothetical protein
MPESALLVLYAALEKETAMGGAKIQTKSLKFLHFLKLMSQYCPVYVPLLLPPHVLKSGFSTFMMNKIKRHLISAGTLRKF